MKKIRIKRDNEPSFWNKCIRIMKLTFLFFLIGLMHLSASVYSQTTKLSLKMRNVKVGEVLDAIEKQSEFRFAYSPGYIDLNREVDVTIRDKTIDESLHVIFSGTDVKYGVYDRHIILYPEGMENKTEKSSVAHSIVQQQSVSGVVTDQSGQPLPGVTVLVKGTVTGTITDGNGNFTLFLPSGAETLQFSFVGMRTQEIPVEGRVLFRVMMEEESIGLGEVVVSALGIEREVKALGFSSQGVSSEDLTSSRELNVTNYLAGKVAGVQVSKTAGGARGSTFVLIRGYKSFSQDNQPLYVVDGVPIYNFTNNDPSNAVANAGIDYGDGIGDINPQDIESVNILKGPAASALYGSRGSNGVVIITTKSGKSAKKGISVEINSSVMAEKISLIPKFQNKFGSGYDDEEYADQGWGTEFNGVYYLWPDNGMVDSWGAPLDGHTLMPNWWTMPYDISSSEIWDCPIDDVVPMLAQPANNVRNFFNTGFTYSNNVSLTSSNDNSNMRLSIADVETTGIVPNEKVTRRSVNFNGTTDVNQVLSFSGKFNYMRTEGNQRSLTGYSESNPLYNLIQMPRNTPLDFVKEQYETTKTNIRYPGINYNPYFMVDKIKNHDFKDRLIGMVSTTLKFNDWLNLMGRVGADYWSQVQENTWPEDPSSKNYNTRLGQMVQDFTRLLDVNADVMLTANRKISESFTLNGVLGASVRSLREEMLNANAKIFKSPGVYDFSNFNDVSVGSYLYRKQMQSVYFTGNIAFKNYLFVDVTGRNDWSSALGVNNYSFFYPSVSSSFVFTDAFNIDNKFLSFGKIRASWAASGNDSSPYMTRAGYNLYSTGFNGLPYASKSSTLPLYNLKNELTKSIELGTDLRFFSNRINIDFTYYNSISSNQILNLPISNASGYSNMVINAGEVRNKGVEMALGLTPVKARDFRWDINFNFAKNNSEVVTLDGNIQTYPLISSSDGEPGLSNIEARVGEAFGNIVGYAYKRAPDGQKIVDVSGSYVRESKLSILGNITPDWTGGLNNSFYYKGFSFNVLLDMVIGGDVVSSTKYEMTRKGTGKWTEEGRRPQSKYLEGDIIPEGSKVGDPMPYTGILDGVVEILDDNGNVTGYEKNTRAVPGQNYWATRAWNGIGEEFVEDGSYISLREVVLSYNFKSSLLNKTPFTGLTISAVGRNLLYLKNGMDYIGVSPESAPNTASGASGIEALTNPSTRTYGFNIKLAF